MLPETENLLDIGRAEIRNGQLGTRNGVAVICLSHPVPVSTIKNKEDGCGFG